MNKRDVLDPSNQLNLHGHNAGKSAVLYFADSPLFYDSEYRYEECFYGRRLRPHVLKHLNFDEPLSLEALHSCRALAANRVLFAMHEVEFLYLPESNKFSSVEFDQFYSKNRQIASGVGIPYLENFLFGFLNEEILISENWSLDLVQEYFINFAESVSEIENLPSADVVDLSTDQKSSALDWLVQLAPDFLIESSPMARYAGGSYGSLGSNLFKIIIDEFGYGVHHKKHSSLFERTLSSVGLVATPHHYWQYYLNGSLLLANYYNMLTRNKRNIFKYIGAIYLAETSFVTSCRIWRDMLLRALPEIEPQYFDEHCHIDIEHSRMVLEQLVTPAIKKYGHVAANDIVRGFEEARWIGDFAEQDFVQQVQWKDTALEKKSIHNVIIGKIKTASSVNVERFTEPKGELSVTHSHDEDELCHIISGTMEFINGFQKSTRLNPSEGIIIQKNRLHGALILSDSCEYEIYTIRDYKSWL